MGFRVDTQETDLSGFVSSSILENGAMVVKSSKGKNTPILCQTDTDVIDNFGYPSAEYPAVFEAISYVRKSPVYVCGAYGDGSKWGGAYVESGSVQSFGYGQVNPDSFLFTAADIQYETTLGTGNGTNRIFSGTLAYTPINTGSLTVSIGGTDIVASETGGVISGSGIDSGGTNTLNVSNGQIFIKTMATPAIGQAVKVKVAYDKNMSTTTSFAVFTASPYTTADLAINIVATGGKKFTLTLYKVVAGVYTQLDVYYFSLIREKDAFGKGLYYEDVFDSNPYIIVKVNAAFPYSAYSIPSTTTKVTLDYGLRVAPLLSNITTAWANFNKTNKYFVNVIMDVLGDSASTVNNLVLTYQPQAQAITTLALGNSVAQSLAARTLLGIDSDDLCIYQGWMKIVDPYNNSYAWISNIGSVGKKFAMMADIYDSGSPAGIDENNHGGQISDWTYVEADEDYSDLELQQLDEAQINPIILDQSYGAMIFGDKTAQVTLSDTSYVGTRRTYKYLIQQITNNILKKQVFKNNDPTHRAKAKTMADDFINSTLYAVGALRSFYVACDDKNNNDRVLEQRRFVLDIYVQATPNSQKVQLKLTRVSQTTVIAELIK